MRSYGHRIHNLLVGVFVYLIAMDLVHITMNAQDNKRLDKIINTQETIQLDLDALDGNQWAMMNRLDSMMLDTFHSNE